MNQMYNSLEGIRVLIVNDDKFLLDYTSHLINQFKGSTDFTIDGKMAVKMVSENIYDIVLMDPYMPVMNGYEATRLIRSMEGDYFRNLPIIIFSRIPDFEKMRESGVTDFFSIDSPKEQLYALLSRYLK
jgi:CheY-like chemotaxis protein